ncbi:MAG: rhodanese-like domain-containing protein [Thermomicrobiales bacterium]
MVRMSRRSALRTTAVGTAVLGFGRFTPSAFAQATPSASPITTGFAHDGVLIPPAAVPAEGARIGVMTPTAFNAGHIPGSRSFTEEQLAVVDTSESGMAAWRATMLETMAGAGVRLGSPTLAYDDGTMFGARAWWVLTYLGFDIPLVLDGGLAAWQDAGGEIERAVSAAASPQAVVVVAGTPETAAAPTPRPQVLATREQVLASLNDPDVVLIDTRPASDYEAGHIPGAINLDYTENGTGGTPNVWKSPDALKTLYASIGATGDKRIIPYCHSGTKSAVTFFTLWLLGYPEIALYTGSWEEWSSDPSDPVTKGSNP